jgi:hypothetical protein
VDRGRRSDRQTADFPPLELRAVYALDQPARCGPGEPLLGSLATHPDRGVDDRPGDPGLAGVVHRVMKGRLGRGGGARRGDDPVHQFLTRFAQHTLRSHHYVNITVT